MAGVACPVCGAAVAPDLINRTSDFASCQACGSTFKPSEAPALAPTIRPFSVERPPRGVSFDWQPQGFRIVATTRSPIAFFLLPFTLVWSGGSLGMLYVVPLLAGEGLGLLSLFGLPFLVASVFLIALTAMAIAGRVAISATGLDGELFVGVGPIGRRRRFHWGDIAAAREDIGTSRSYQRGRQRTQRTARVCLEGNERICFGSTLGEDQRFYLVRALSILLARLQGRSAPAPSPTSTPADGPAPTALRDRSSPDPDDMPDSFD